MMGLTKSVAETDYPITLEECKAHLNITHDYDDDLLNALIGASTQYVQEQARHQLMSATYQYTLDEFPSCRTILLPMGILQSVTSITYYDADNAQQTFSSSNYTVDTSSQPGRIVLNDGSAWETTYERPAAVTITYVAGYSSQANVPVLAKLLVKEIVGLHYENREAVSPLTLKEIPMTGRTILNSLTFIEAF